MPPLPPPLRGALHIAGEKGREKKRKKNRSGRRRKRKNHPEPPSQAAGSRHSIKSSIENLTSTPLTILVSGSAFINQYLLLFLGAPSSLSTLFPTPSSSFSFSFSFSFSSTRARTRNARFAGGGSGSDGDGGAPPSSRACRARFLRVICPMRYA